MRCAHNVATYQAQYCTAHQSGPHHSPVTTLGAYRRKGATIETVVTVDPTHTEKNGSLQVLHLTRLPMLGDYVMLTMMLVAVREAESMTFSIL